MKKRREVIYLIYVKLSGGRDFHSEDYPLIYSRRADAERILSDGPLAKRYVKKFVSVG